jgi:hypothetical protein
MKKAIHTAQPMRYFISAFRQKNPSNEIDIYVSDFIDFKNEVIKSMLENKDTFLFLGDYRIKRLFLNFRNAVEYLVNELKDSDGNNPFEQEYCTDDSGDSLLFKDYALGFLGFAEKWYFGMDSIRERDIFINEIEYAFETYAMHHIKAIEIGRLKEAIAAEKVENVAKKARVQAYVEELTPQYAHLKEYLDLSDNTLVAFVQRRAEEKDEKSLNTI